MWKIKGPYLNIMEIVDLIRKLHENYGIWRPHMGPNEIEGILENGPI